MAFEPVALNILGIPITYASITVGVITAGLFYTGVRFACPAGFYLARKLFAHFTDTRMNTTASNVAGLKSRGGIIPGGQGTGGTLPGGGGGGGLGGGGGGIIGGGK